MKKRKRFEYKAQRRTKEKEVFMQYVQYEINLLQLIKMRREVFLDFTFFPFETLKKSLIF